MLDMMRTLVNHWHPLTHSSHCMTTSRPAAATQTGARVTPTMHPKVFLRLASKTASLLKTLINRTQHICNTLFTRDDRVKHHNSNRLFAARDSLGIAAVQTQRAVQDYLAVNARAVKMYLQEVGCVAQW